MDENKHDPILNFVYSPSLFESYIVTISFTVRFGYSSMLKDTGVAIRWLEPNNNGEEGD